MCPRSRYADELMIPQLLELIDRYGVDGFWIDGDLWAMEPCYCDRCREAFRAEDRNRRASQGAGRSALARLVGFYAAELRAIRHPLLRRGSSAQAGRAGLLELAANAARSGRAQGPHGLDQRRQRGRVGPGQLPLRGPLHLDPRQALGHHDVVLLLLRTVNSSGPTGP